MIKLFQIYYDHHQKKDLLEDFIPYMNKKKSMFVENQCIYDIRHDSCIKNASHLGVFSYRFHKKIYSKPTFKTISQHISSNPDVDIFSAKLENYWWSAIREPRPLCFPNQSNMKDLAIPFLKDLADLGVIKQSSIDLWTKVYDKSIYCNFWVAKKSVFIDYVDNFLEKVFDLILSYDKNHYVFSLEKKYGRPPIDWQESTGFSHYPIITFILERLINLYILDKNLNHKALI